MLQVVTIVRIYTLSSIAWNEFYLAKIFNNATTSTVLINSVKFRYNTVSIKPSYITIIYRIRHNEMRLFMETMHSMKMVLQYSDDTDMDGIGNTAEENPIWMF